MTFMTLTMKAYQNVKDESQNRWLLYNNPNLNMDVLEYNCEDVLYNMILTIKYSG